MYAISHLLREGSGHAETIASTRIAEGPGQLDTIGTIRWILAASLVLFSTPVLVLYFLFQRQFIEGLTTGALKH